MDPLVLGIGAAALYLLLKKKKGVAGVTPTPGVPTEPVVPGKPTPGTGPTGPGWKPGKPSGPGWEPPDPKRTYKWGTGAVPEDFDWDSNMFWISPDCDTVVEGYLFETASWQDSLNAIEAPTLMETLAAETYPGMDPPDNTVYGFIDYIMTYEGYDSAEGVALRVVQEANALCADVPMDNWPEELSEWFASFVERIGPWVDNNLGEIGFEP
jgi:hypothetical protein